MDLLLGLIAEVVFGWRSVEPAPPEGEWNASLGSVAALSSGVGALFGGMMCAVILTTSAVERARDGTPALLFVGVTFACATAGWLAAGRAMRVTPRRRPLAYAARWLAYVTWAVVAVAAAKLVFGG